MKKIILFILFSFALIFQNTFAQKENIYKKDKRFELGFINEITIINNNMLYTKPSNKKDNSINIYPLNLFISGKLYLTNYFCVEIRPGIMFGGEYFSGTELGFYFRYYFHKYYIVSGINFHNNFGDAHGLSHYIEVYDLTYKAINFSFGYKLGNHLGILLGYFYPLEKYKMAKIVNSLYETNDQYEEYFIELENIIKVGVEYTF